MVRCIVLLLVVLNYAKAADIYVAIENNRESRLIARFCGKKFSETAVGPVSDRLDEARAAVIDDITVIRWDDLEARKKYGHVPSTGLPQYKIGRYGQWKRFDGRVWESMSFLPAYFDYLQREFTYHELVIEQDKLIAQQELGAYFEWSPIIPILYSYNCERIIISYDDLVRETWKVRNKYNKDVPIVPVIAKPPRPILKNPLDAFPSLD